MEVYIGLQVPEAWNFPPLAVIYGLEGGKVKGVGAYPGKVGEKLGLQKHLKHGALLRGDLSFLLQFKGNVFCGFPGHRLPVIDIHAVFVNADLLTELIDPLIFSECM